MTAYDVRGKIPDDFDEQIALRIALAFTRHCRVRTMVLGQDMRLTSPLIAQTITDGLLRQGVNIIDIGLCGTEEVYHAVFSGTAAGIDGGIMITASHNPAAYNGMKIVQRESRPVSCDSGLNEIAEMAADPDWYRQQCTLPPVERGRLTRIADKRAYITHLLSMVDRTAMQPMTIVVNAGNGCAGPVLDLLAAHLPFTFVRLNHQPDGSFPNGVPNPLLPEKREATARAVREHRADLGIAWDGDFDRCFFYDENGRFIEGYYIVGLLAVAMLQQSPGATILHDPRLTWNTREMVRAAGGTAIMTRTGHAFIKANMRALNAVYGGEMSAHHYFRDFGFCDSGMLPWLLVCQLMSISGKPLSALVDERMTAFPVSGEINSTVTDPDAVISRIEQRYADGRKESLDGLSVEYPDYRFNLRKSNTEPVLRLNVETRGDQRLLEQKTAELLDLIRT
jgi:phosphomannomutase